jgi:antitoxin component YwqK of YwqJK toxin-antitoxin module
MKLFRNTVQIILTTATFLFANTHSQAQIFPFDNQTIPYDVMPFSYLDKKIDTAVKVIDVATLEENMTFANIIDKLPATKPTLILYWKIEWFVTHTNTVATAKLMEQLIKQNKANYNIVLVNTSTPGDGFNVNDFINPQEFALLKTQSGVDFGNTPQYADYYRHHYSAYGISTAPLSAFVLDKNRRIIASHPAITAENKDAFNNRLTSLKDKNFTAGKWYFDKDYNRVPTLEEAVSYVEEEKKPGDLIQVTQYTKSPKKLQSQFAYKTKADVSATDYAWFFPEGPFVFYSATTGELLSKGDCTSGLINNLTAYNGKNIVFQISNYTALNKAYLQNPRAIADNLFAKSNETPRKSSDNSTPATVTFYHDNFVKKEIKQFDKNGYLILHNKYFESGKPSAERTWNVHKYYNKQDVLVSIYSYNENGKKHGKQLTSYDNGKPEEITYYNNGSEDWNNRERYYENGNKKEISVNGKTNYYFKNGQLFWIFNTAKSNQQETLYYPDGRTAAVVQFDSKGVVTCSSKFYDRNGRELTKPYSLNKMIDNLFALYIISYQNADKTSPENEDNFTKSLGDAANKARKEWFMLHFNLNNTENVVSNSAIFTETKNRLCE